MLPVAISKAMDNSCLVFDHAAATKHGIGSIVIRVCFYASCTGEVGGGMNF